MRGGANMELNPREQQIVDAMKMLGATSETSYKQVDDIARRANMDKNTTANLLMSLVNKKVVKRVAREKSAAYYLMQA
jgi:DNA-binding IclR family transcriptional regulator